MKDEIKSLINAAIIEEMKKYMIQENYLDKLTDDGVLTKYGMEYRTKDGYYQDYEHMGIDIFSYTQEDTVYKCETIMWSLPNDVMFRKGTERRSRIDTYTRGTLKDVEIEVTYNVKTGEPQAKILAINPNLNYEEKYYD